MRGFLLQFPTGFNEYQEYELLPPYLSRGCRKSRFSEQITQQHCKDKDNLKQILYQLVWHGMIHPN